MRIKLLLLMFVIFFLMECGLSEKRFEIVKGGKPKAVIVVGSGASEDEMSAADELQIYIEKSSGVLIPIRRDDEEVSGNVIAVGRNEININSGLGFDELQKEGFRIKADVNILSLAGKDDTGTQVAVYSFLEKYLGIRWFWPGELGEVVPQLKTISVGQIDDTEEHDYKWRNRGPDGALWGSPTGPTEMHARELVLGITREHQKEVELWEKRNKYGGMKIYGGHVLGEIFPPEKYAKTNPEYYALVNGKREVPGKDYDYKHGGQICTTNPEVIKVTIEWVRRFLDEYPDYDAVHVTMNDGRGFCECENCRALDSGEFVKRPGIDAEEMKKRPARYTVITDRIFTFANQVAEEVQKTHPGKYIANMAYSRYLTPPKRIKLHPYVIPQYCLWSAYKHASADVRKEHEGIAAAWANASEKTGIYEYYINGSWPGLHRVVMPYIAESIKYLYNQGIDLYQMQSGDEFAINGMNYYVAAKLLWDTSLDEREILDDFYEKAFGDAGDAIRRFHIRLQNAWTMLTINGEDVSCQSLKRTRLLRYFTPELLGECQRYLMEALKEADNEIVKKRVEFYAKGFSYALLTVDAVRASKRLELSGIDLFQPERAKQKVRELDDENINNQIAIALEAWETRDGFVEEMMNDYVLAYFWVKYNNMSRSFNPVKTLRELSKIKNIK